MTLLLGSFCSTDSNAESSWTTSCSDLTLIEVCSGSSAPVGLVGGGARDTRIGVGMAYRPRRSGASPGLDWTPKDTRSFFFSELGTPTDETRREALTSPPMLERRRSPPMLERRRLLMSASRDTDISLLASCSSSAGGGGCEVSLFALVGRTTFLSCELGCFFSGEGITEVALGEIRTDSEASVATSCVAGAVFAFFLPEALPSPLVGFFIAIASRNGVGSAFRPWAASTSAAARLLADAALFISAI